MQKRAAKTIMTRVYHHLDPAGLLPRAQTIVTPSVAISANLASVIIRLDDESRRTKRVADRDDVRSLASEGIVATLRDGTLAQEEEGEVETTNETR
jgi:hypothetical protein